jgi:PleD family two-component response regulator
MKIVVLDVDQSHNLRLETSLNSVAKLNLVFCHETSELLEILNPDQSLQTKLKRMEKSVVDGTAMLQKTQAGLAKAQTQLAEESKQGATQKSVELQAGIKSSEELKAKIEQALVARKKEIEHLSANVLKEEDKKVNLVLVDRSFLGNLPSDWLIELRKKTEFAGNQEVPVITMGYNEDLNYIRNTLHGGVLDYFVKPVDLLLLKFHLARLFGLGDPSDGKIFEMQTKAEIKFLRTATLLKMSEFEIHVQAESDCQVGELVEFYTEIFDRRSEGRMLARCMKSEPDATRKGWFSISFGLVGNTPLIMTEMRKWIRAQYVLSKKEA